jgi:protoheme IX farnesyltransferase
MPTVVLPLKPTALARGRARIGLRARAKIGAVYDLAKPRLAAMSVLTTLVAYATARPAGDTTGATIAGTTLAAAGALSLNQWWERSSDAVMQRTKSRPLPRAILSPGTALAWSVSWSIAGVALLAFSVNAAAAVVAAATILVYGLVYTPLKRRTRWATEIGAISGALPALLGNAAAGDLAARPGLVLTAILLFWQMPHFFAIGWKHRADYRAAGFPLLPAVDRSGRRTAHWSFGYTIVLVGVSVAPWTLGWLDAAYGTVVAAAGGWLAWRAWSFVRATDRDAAARRLFLGTLIYLPLVMAAMIIAQSITSR